MGGVRVRDHAAALRYYADPLALYKTAGDTCSIADTHDHLARAHAELGDIGRAREHGRRALRLYRDQLRTTDVARMDGWLAGLP